MSFSKKFTALLTFATILATPVSATSLLFSETRDFGSDAGQIAPTNEPNGGNAILTPDAVLVRSDNVSDSRLQFRDTFDFRSILPASIERFELEFAFENAGPARFERWGFVVDGSQFFPNNPASLQTNRFQGSNSFLDDALSPQTFEFTSAIDGTGLFSTSDAFAHSVATGEFTYWFYTTGINSFDLDSATLRVYGNGNGVTAVPLPAGGLLLLSGSVVVRLARKRKS